MKKIELSQGQFALIDDEDFEKVSQHKWYARLHRYTFYGMRNIKVNGRWTTLQLHRFILNSGPDEQVDHRDGNGLNNSRSNLRVATHCHNRQNSRKHKNNTSGFKGVSFNRRVRKWVAYINVNRKRVHLGYFETVEKAHLSYREASKEYHADFARVD